MFSSNDEGVCGCLLGPTVVLVETQHVAVFLGHSLAAQILRVTHSLTITTKRERQQGRLTVKAILTVKRKLAVKIGQQSRRDNY